MKIFNYKIILDSYFSILKFLLIIIYMFLLPLSQADLFLPSYISDLIVAAILLLLIAEISLYKLSLRIDIFICFIVVSLFLPVCLFFAQKKLNIYYPDRDSAEFLFRAMLFVLIGASLNTKLHRLFLFISFLGFVLVAIVNNEFNLSDVFLAFEMKWNTRMYFGYWNPQHPSMFFGIAVIFSLIFLLYININWFKLYLIKSAELLTLIIFLVSIIGVYLTQSRGIWLGLFTCVLFFCLVNTKKFILNFRKFSKIILIFIFIFIFAILFLGDKVYQRFYLEKDTLSKIVSGDLKEIRDTSFGTRFHLWRFGIKKISERPILGWGERANGKLIRQNSNFPWSGRRYHLGHFHNSYIEAGVAYGIGGIIFIFALFAYILKRGYHLYKKGVMPPEFWHITFYCTIFFLIINCFESFMFKWTGIHAMVVMYAPLYAWHLQDLYGDGSENDVDSEQTSKIESDPA